MKPVFEKTDNDRNVILISKITTKHLIVGHNYRKEPIILTNEKSAGGYIWKYFKQEKNRNYE